MQPFRTFLHWDRRPAFALAWRALVSLAVLRPWAFRFERVTLDLGALEPRILQAAREAGIDPSSPAGWSTVSSVVMAVLVTGLALGALWWMSNLGWRALLRRRGPGLAPVLALLGGFLATLTLIPALSAALLPTGISGFEGTVAVFGGWLHHPGFLLGGFLNALLTAAFLGVLLAELLLFMAEARTAFQEAQEGALRARLSPHFLYNTLNTLASDIEAEPARAVESTHRLASLLEQVTRAVDQPRVPLREELAFVEDYLALVRRRMGERLRVTVDLPEEHLDREVPVLGLQILVENALRHALAPRVEGGSLILRSWVEGRRLWVGVTDSGDGVSLAPPGTGQALSNLAARLDRPSDLRRDRVAGGYRVAFAVRG